MLRERKILVYVIVVMFNTWKCVATNVKKGYSQMGNELLHEAGSSWIVQAAQKDIPVSLFNFSALLLILN